MKRPLLVWLAFAACALVGFGVLAWFTREMVRLDRESTEARELAAVEENIRLALWRMDSALASIHGLEASRPATDYKPFFATGAAYSPTLDALPPDSVWLPSPLLRYRPPFVVLHFQVESDGTVGSPQAPDITLRDAALAERIGAALFGAPDAVLQRVRALLSDVARAASTLSVYPPPPSDHEKKVQFDWSLGRNAGAFEGSSAMPAKDEIAEQLLPIPMLAASPRDEAFVQQQKGIAEQRERAATVDLNLAYNAQIADNRARNQSPSLPRSEEDAGRQSPPPPPVAGTNDVPTTSSPGSAAVAIPAGETSPANETLIANQQNRADSPAAADASLQSAVTAGSNSTGPLLAQWSDDDLMLYRHAVLDGRAVMQGVWLDWPELQAWLLSRISDLLPQARLIPAQPGSAATALDAARRLAFLPAQLVPGSANISAGTLASPLRISLGLAWAGAVIGLGALALLLRGTVRLSERRGAFVSAVTHELRTPLTTFRMYTEMLAGGMVTDETRRRGYVDTLRKEAERLSHLVENVLSYARLERGRAASRVEDTTPAELLTRIEERLAQRAQQGGLTVRLDLPDDTAHLPLRTDTTAVEQVLFNLVDNATKYGRPRDGAAGEIVLAVSRVRANRLAFRVVDHGPGLTAAARRRLFQPFSKSATEAAHTQPGVGLGLALCRRLARDELGGDLVLERSGAEGTVFRLELPG